MHARKWLLAAGGFLIASLGSGAPTRAMGAESVTQAALAHAVQFRADFHLSADPLFVASTFNKDEYDDPTSASRFRSKNWSTWRTARKYAKRLSRCWRRPRTPPATPAPIQIMHAGVYPCSLRPRARRFGPLLSLCPTQASHTRSETSSTRWLNSKQFKIR